MTDPLVARADALRQAARQVLEDQGLLRLCEALGPTQVVGSYAYDVMTRPDIDVSIQLAASTDTALMLQLAAQIVSALTVMRLTYINDAIDERPVYQAGLYLGVQFRHQGEKWKADIWGFGPEQYAQQRAYSEQLRAALKSIDRRPILLLKTALMQRGTYRSTVSSIALYEAIIDGVRTLAAFDAWWAARA